MEGNNIFLADIIYYFHIFIILCVLIMPFSNSPAILILHITGCITLLVHWMTNSNVCSLTVLESQLRGVDRVQTFTHEFIAPIYDISSTKWGYLCTLITLIVLFISIMKLTNSERMKQLWKLCKDINSKHYDSYFVKIKDYMECLANSKILNIV